MRLIINIRCFLVIAGTIILFNKSNAQETTKYSLQMLARPTPDSIMLRWAPTDFDSWQFGNEQGYIVARYTIYSHGVRKQSAPVILTPHPLTPVPVSEWEVLSETDNFAGIAAQAIYGESFEPMTEEASPVIGIFNKATEQDNRYSFALFSADQSASVARNMGLMYVDKNVKAGEKYLYVVYFNTHNGEQSDTAYAYTGIDEYVPLPKPVITSIIPGDKTATLEWKKTIGRMAYTSYEIERSEDDGKSFQVLMDAPLINVSEEKEDHKFGFYIDTLGNNTSSYTYRVRGINPFGEKGPYSDTMSVVGVEPIKDVPFIVKKETLPDGVHLEWEFDENSEYIIKSFKILRSKISNREFIPVSDDLAPNTRTFIDSMPMSTNYYKVFVTAKSGTSVSSFPVLVQLVDSVPPSPPTGLKADIDSLGNVSLYWPPNTEADIFGYRIYRANARHEEFSQITVAPVQDTVFKDLIQLKTLSEKVYYRLMAIDKRQNHSNFSEIFEIKRPDVVPPATPVIQTIESDSNGICLTWLLSSSSDVLHNIIYRKEKSESKWEQIVQLNDSSVSFCDTSAKSQIIYNYTVRSMDGAGNESTTIGLVVSGKYRAKKQQLNLHVELSRGRQEIQLTWNDIQNLERAIVYRSEGEEALKVYASFNPTGNSFIDKKIKPDTDYTYLIKIVTSQGVLLSNKIKVSY